VNTWNGFGIATRDNITPAPPSNSPASLTVLPSSIAVIVNVSVCVAVAPVP